MQLELARLNYGASSYTVQRTEFLPIPEVFDFDNPVQCAKLVLAMMSNASGGFTLRDCKLRIHRGRKTANITASGCHVFYAPKDRGKLTVEQAIAMEQEIETFLLGSVGTDQYGGGYKRARWEGAV